MTDFMQHTNGFSNFPGAIVDPQAQNDPSQTTDNPSEQNTQEQQHQQSSQPNLQLNYCECCQTSYKKFYKSCNKCGMPANWKNLLESDRKPLDFYLAKREEKAQRIAKSADIYANFKQNQAIKKILPGYVAPKFNVNKLNLNNKNKVMRNFILEKEKEIAIKIGLSAIKLKIGEDKYVKFQTRDGLEHEYLKKEDDSEKTPKTDDAEPETTDKPKQAPLLATKKDNLTPTGPPPHIRERYKIDEIDTSACNKGKYIYTYEAKKITKPHTKPIDRETYQEEVLKDESGEKVRYAVMKTYFWGGVEGEELVVFLFFFSFLCLAGTKNI